jgi:hypothetical protein
MTAATTQPDTSSPGQRFRVRGRLASDKVLESQPGIVFVRTSYDQRSRSVLERTEHGYQVRHEAFRTGYWEWRETTNIRREFSADQGEAACRYFNSLSLSPGYLGPTLVEPD